MLGPEQNHGNLNPEGHLLSVNWGVVAAGFGTWGWSWEDKWLLRHCWNDQWLGLSEKHHLISFISREAFLLPASLVTFFLLVSVPRSELRWWHVFSPFLGAGSASDSLHNLGEHCILSESLLVYSQSKKSFLPTQLTLGLEQYCRCCSQGQRVVYAPARWGPEMCLNWNPSVCYRAFTGLDSGGCFIWMSASLGWLETVLLRG